MRIQVTVDSQVEHDSVNKQIMLQTHHSEI